MSAGRERDGACAMPLAWEDLVAYWAGDLDPAEVDRVDEHVIGCAHCFQASARVSSVTEALRRMVPPFVDHAQLDALRARGLRIADNPILPDERAPVHFSYETDLLIHRLHGLDLTKAVQVAMTITVEGAGDVLLHEPSAPFDRESGEMIIVCQRHFASFPPNVVAEVRVHDAAGRVELTRYPIPHLFDARLGS